ncbi:MAG: hypothetical protein AAF806_18480 [Bacteroidota bacterium]
MSRSEENNTDHLIDEALLAEGIEMQYILFTWETPYELERLQITA